MIMMMVMVMMQIMFRRTRSGGGSAASSSASAFCKIFNFVRVIIIFIIILVMMMIMMISFMIAVPQCVKLWFYRFFVFSLFSWTIVFKPPALLQSFFAPFGGISKSNSRSARKFLRKKGFSLLCVEENRFCGMYQGIQLAFQIKFKIQFHSKVGQSDFNKVELETKHKIWKVRFIVLPELAWIESECHEWNSHIWMLCPKI